MRLLPLLACAFISMAGCGSKNTEDKASDSVAVAPEAVAAGSEVAAEEVGPSPLRIRSAGPLARTFNDSNHVHFAHAKRLGIDPIHSLSQAYHTKRPLVHVETSKNILVDSLTHSMPFLVPEAAQLLDDIGSAFIDSLARRGARGYRVKVTSMLRTPSTVKRLRRVNRNATDSSTHQFGTTFDLSYTHFDAAPDAPFLTQEHLKNMLAEVLLNMRDEGRCLVKYERHTSCFHVTATR